MGALASLRAVAAQAQADESAAADPLLRKIITASILCYTAPTSRWETDAAAPEPGEAEPVTRWLKTVEKAGVDRMEEAERLGWLAYSTGNFEEASRWLARADPGTGLSLWLKAKLDFRAGKVKEATATMAKAVRKIPKVEELKARNPGFYEAMQPVVAAGDLGLLRLARKEFTAAFHAFLQGDHWQDAAFVAERILTVKELRERVDRDFPEATEETQPEQSGLGGVSKKDQRSAVRWLLARRLVRIGEFRQARAYLPAEYRETVDAYAEALKEASAKKVKPEKRAEALWKAAVIARKHGMQLMGTELEPDAFSYGGMYDASDIRTERLSGFYTATRYPSDGPEIVKKKKLVIPSSPEERKRLQRNEVEPEKRFHYRYTAAGLAWRAAKFLPDNSEITADVLNTAGGWLKARDPKAADRFYQALERRCAKTEIGEAAIALHWFPEKKGPWSAEIQP